MVLSMIHLCFREYLSTFCQQDILRRQAADLLFKHVIQYVDKQSLDVVLCSKLESKVLNGHLIIAVSELGGSENGIR